MRKSMFLFSVPDLSFCPFLCVSTRRTCLCLAKTAGECYLCLSLPSFFSLFLSLYHPSILWGKPNFLHGEKQSYQAAVHLVYQSLSSRAYMRLGSYLGSQACFSRSVWKLWGCFSSAQGVECGFLVWKRRMRSPEVMLECVEALLGQLGAPGAVHGAESHAAFSKLFQIVKF